MIDHLATWSELVLCRSVLGPFEAKLARMPTELFFLRPVTYRAGLLGTGHVRGMKKYTQMPDFCY